MSDYSLVPFTNIKEVLPILEKISLFGGLNDEELYTLAIENLDNLHKRRTEKEKFEKNALELNLEILKEFFIRNKELIKNLQS